jgi:UDPglucose 6-dehydrogenase
MNVTIIGTGYVGLVSGVCLAERGHQVICVDLNSEIVESLNDGQPHFFEPGLEDLLKDVRRRGRFQATLELTLALARADIAIIAVGTPSVDGAIDLTYVKEAVASIGRFIRTSQRHISVVVKSTVVPGTTDSVVLPYLEKVSAKAVGSFGVGMNPEFLREGKAVTDFAQPDRIVLGYEDEETLRKLEELYSSWGVDKLRVNTRTAEMIKYANNCLLATQISAVNELANLSASLGGIDIAHVVRGVHLDHRWSPLLEGGGRLQPEVLTYHMPGCGFGGSCFPKDVQALRTQGAAQGLPMHILNAVLEVNEAQPEQIPKILEADLHDLRGREVLLLGLAFKPDTDDVRESASLKVAKSLIDKGARVAAHDPHAMHNFKAEIGISSPNLQYVENWCEAAEKAQVIVVVTAWREYQKLKDLKLRNKIVFDARRMFSSDQLVGNVYRTIGRRLASIQAAEAM